MKQAPIHEAAADRLLADQRRKTIAEILEAPTPRKPSKKRVVDNGQFDLWRCIYICPDGTNGHLHGTIKQCLGRVKKLGAHSISFVKGDLGKVGAQ